MWKIWREKQSKNPSFSFTYKGTFQKPKQPKCWKWETITIKDKNSQIQIIETEENKEGI